jgi:hypothetical protein
MPDLCGAEKWGIARYEQALRTRYRGKWSDYCRKLGINHCKTVS